MKKLNTVQKVILATGIISVLVAIYGKFNNWEYHDYFVLFYMGTTFMWITFLNTDNRCERAFIRRIFTKGPSKNDL